MSARTSTAEACLDALRALESGEREPGECFPWNSDFVHGHAARDVARVVGIRWAEALLLLDELAEARRVIRVVPRRSRTRRPVPVYRTVGS
jgi:hypothetical protein